MANEEYYKKHKKKVARGFLFGIVLTVLSIIIGIIMQDESPYVIGFVVFIFAWYRWSKKHTKLERSFCPKCHAHYDYEDDIEWEVLSEYVKNDNKSGTSASREARMKFYCTCPECGERQTFVATVKIATASLNHTSFSDPDTEAKKLFIE